MDLSPHFIWKIMGFGTCFGDIERIMPIIRPDFTVHLPLGYPRAVYQVVN